MLMASNTSKQKSIHAYASKFSKWKLSHAYRELK